jgi:hypothetical protein
VGLCCTSSPARLNFGKSSYIPLGVANVPVAEFAKIQFIEAGRAGRPQTGVLYWQLGFSHQELP